MQASSTLGSTRQGLGSNQKKKERYMFVRWKSRKLKKNPGYSFYAVLLSGERKDGKVFHNFYRYLGAFREHQMDIAHRLRFWKSITRKLDELNLTRDLRHKIEIKLAGKVPPPTALERKKHFQQIARFEAMVNKKMGKIG
jgi:hypothetical protein